MKIILTGSTGFIGAEILKQCIAHNYIDHIYILTRRPVDAAYARHKKVTQILHEDFENFPADLLDRLRSEGVEACIWALGGPVKKFANLDEARRVGVNFPAHAAEMLARHVAPGLRPYEGYPGSPPRAGQKRFPFRFVYVSGWGAERDQFRKLWMFSDTRKIKGAAEKAICAVAEGCEEVEGHRCFEVVCLRPGGVLSGSGEDVGALLTEAVVPSIAVGVLARTAVRVAFDGGADGKTIMENKDCLGEDWAMINSLS